jgi:glycosyltransferase involved in cell wall biosynthesis
VSRSGFAIATTCYTAGVRVGLDLTALLPEATGVDVSLLGLARELVRDDGADYTLFVNREDRPRFDGWTGDARVLPLCLRPRPARLTFQQMLLPALAASLRLDVVHSPSFIMPLVRGGVRHVLTIHDLTSFSLPDAHVPLRRSAAYRRAVAASIRRADAVTVPSHFVRADLLQRFPGVAPARVQVVPWGIDAAFRPRPRDEARRDVAHLALPERYVLFVGTLEPRKNLRMLVAAWRRLVAAGSATGELVLAGRLGWEYAPLLAEIAAPALAGRVRQLGYVAQQDLPALYAAADAFVYPSLEEGFGFPPLEAMACGVPVVASDGSALAENLGDAALLVPPSDDAALADAIARVQHDPCLREDLRRRGLERAARFHWTASATAARRSYAAALSRTA